MAKSGTVQARTGRGVVGAPAAEGEAGTGTGVGGMERLRGWFAGKGWRPYPFQEEAWAAYARGASGLIHVPTGAGKTYAAYIGALAEVLDEVAAGGGGKKEGGGGTGGAPRPSVPLGVGGGGGGLRILYVTPLRAVSRDIELALKAPVRDLGVLAETAREERKAGRVTVESRTGDTSSSVRTRQRERLPTVLITTPESLTLLLTREDAAEKFAGLRCVICDEWHELLSSKRGTQVELALARLRRFAPGVRTWALSATIANLEEAGRAAVGVGKWADGRSEGKGEDAGGTPVPRGSGGRGGVGEPVIVSGEIDRPVVIETLLPRAGDPFPWAGHLGLSMLPRVIEAIDPSHSTLIFVNTRSQSEMWFHALQAAKPEWFPILGLHHGSIDREERERVEAGLKDGSVKIVVATSSLDLGVDFAPVERVFQIGSPKGIARLMQRAGRASHRPGERCHIVCVPTHALEMLEVAAVRRAVEMGFVESRTSESRPLDVLAQHLVTVGLGGGFDAEELFEEVRTTNAYRDLTREEFEWTLSLVREGGGTLRAYPEYHRVVPRDGTGVYTVPDKKIAQLHRLNVGTITGDATMDLRYVSGKRIGSIEENFIGNLRVGERFYFAGKVLEYVRQRDLTAYVKPSSGQTKLTPIWSGTRLPITESLADGVRHVLEEAGADAGRGESGYPEVRAFAPFVRAQLRHSVVPRAGETLVEIAETRDGRHLFVYPFEGRLVHGGIAAVAALRIGRLRGATFTLSSNDYGFELLTGKGFPFEEVLSGELFTEENLAEDAVESVNMSLLARQQFREIARISGLVFQTYPGAPRSARQLQSRAGLLFDVFQEFDPENLLLHQARREVLEKQFEASRLARTMRRLRTQPMRIVETKRPTPLSLPLIVERIGGRLSSEGLLDRIAKMRKGWE